MIRIANLTLPLAHTPDDLPAAICAALAITPDRLERFQIVRRGNDARKRGRSSWSMWSMWR